MKKSEIEVGGLYVAKVSGKLTTVRVDSVIEVPGVKAKDIPASPNGTGLGAYRRKGRPGQTHYTATNLATGRKVSFRSAAKFKEVAIGESKSTKATGADYLAQAMHKPGYFGEETDPLRPETAPEIDPGDNDLCVCGHDRGHHTNSIQECWKCGCGVFRSETDPVEETECQRTAECLEAGAELGDACEVCGGIVTVECSDPIQGVSTAFSSPNWGKAPTAPANVLIGRVRAAGEEEVECSDPTSADSAPAPSVDSDELEPMPSPGPESVRPEATADRLRLEERLVRSVVPVKEMKPWMEMDYKELKLPDQVERNAEGPDVGEAEQRPDPTHMSSLVSVTPAMSSGLVSRLRSPSEDIPQMSKKGHPLTAEQVRGMEMARQIQVAKSKGQRVLVLKAGAGCGKTAECEELELVLSGHGQYTAFNRPLVDEGRTKFTRAACNTTHSLAYRECGREFAHRFPGKVRRARSDEIARLLLLEGIHVETGETAEDGTPRTKWLSPSFLLGQVIGAVKRFMQSADRSVEAGHFGYIDGVDLPVTRADGSQKRGYENNDRLKEKLVPAARRMWADLADPKGTLPLPSLAHDAYVKVWQLSDGPTIAADYIMLDEYQDTAPVFLDILMRQRHALLILVGDDNQRIYAWRGAVNAGDYFPDAPVQWLSQSFRFGQAVADVANSVLALLDEPTDLVMRGFDRIPSRVCAVAQPRCYIYRTNAGAVGRVMTAIGEGKRPHLFGGGADVVTFCEAATQLQTGKRTDHPELGCFESWNEVETYSETEEGKDLQLMVKLIGAFTAEKIRDALKHMPEEKDADLVCTTVHRSKGREWQSVKLGHDFPTQNRMGDEDVRLLYVAATRGQEELDVTECPPFCGGQDKKWGEGGEEPGWVPGIRIRYTAPMPTKEQTEDYQERKAIDYMNDVEASVLAADPRAYDQPKTGVIDDTGPSQSNGSPRLLPGEGAPFTWASIDGKWLVRGPRDRKAGERVTVTRKSGSTSQETLGAVAKKIGDLWFYSTRSTDAAGK